MPDLLYDKYPEDHYAIFTMNRPDRLNALGGTTQQDLDIAMMDFVNDPQMFVGILTGAGRAFSAGADLREMAERNAATAELDARFERGEISEDDRNAELLRLRGVGRGSGVQSGAFTFANCPKPIIAAINGLAVGGGTERAISCDIRIISSEAYMGLFEVKRGIMPGSGVHVLPRMVPFGEAMYIGLTADRVTPEYALRIGLVHEVVEPDRLMPRAVEIAKLIAENAPIAVRGVKAIANFWKHYGMDEQYRYSEWVSRFVSGSEDSKEGPRAFAEKRAPVWQNR